METYDHRKLAVITGASKGLGHSLAKELAINGYNLILVARSGQLLEQVAAETRNLGAITETFAVDLTEKINIERLAALCSKKEIDVLINNAGVVAIDCIDKMKAKEIAKLVELNLIAPMCLVSALVPAFKQRRRGTIVNVNSTAGKKPVLHHAIYCATKYGLNGFSESLQLELQEYGIRVISICPARMRTELHKSAGINVDMSDYLSPDDVARAIVSAINFPKNCCISEMVFKRIPQQK